MINLPFNIFKLGKSGAGKIKTIEELTPFEKIKELIAPPGVEFSSNYFQIGNVYGRVLLVLDYPSYLNAGWLESLINITEPFNICLYFYPLDTQTALKELEKQLARISAQIYEREEAGKVRSPELEAAYKNIEELRDLLVQAEEKLLDVCLYITIFSPDKRELDFKTDKIIKTLESELVTVKTVIFQQKDGFFSTTPLFLDKLKVSYKLNSSTLSSFFPFISSELIEDEGIFFGINLQNRGLVILNRWKYENPHLVILARSGAGKSYTAKLEVMRNLMVGTDVLILDPENEYLSIAELYGGSFIPLSLGSEKSFNPFDLPPVLPHEEPESIYKEHVADLLNLCQLLMARKLSAEELAILDQAINQTYSSFNILPNQDFSKIERFPTLNDLEKILGSLVGGEELAANLYPYTQGNFSGFINRPTTIEMNKRLICFGFKDLPDILRPLGMFVVLNYILNRVRRELKRRLVIIDEAWWLMKQEAGANFLLNTIKRGRKYNLAVTNITQDVEDFLNSPMGRPIITNSALVLLMKQSPVTIDICEKVFSLTSKEKQFLLQAERGQGLIIAGLKKVPVYILGSFAEDQIIRTRPEQLISLKRAKEVLNIK